MTAPSVCRGGTHVTTLDSYSCACGDITYVPAVRDRYWQCHGDCTVDCGACKGHGRPAEVPPAFAVGEHYDGNEIVDSRLSADGDVVVTLYGGEVVTNPEPPAETQQDDEVERVARALAEAADDGACFDRSAYTDEEWADGAGEDDREWHRKLARAALAARPSADTEKLDRMRAAVERAIPADVVPRINFDWLMRDLRAALDGGR